MNYAVSDQILNNDAQALIQERYFPKNTPANDEWFRLLSEKLTQHYAAENRHHQQQCYENLLREKKFFPTSAALVNALGKKKALSGCIVMPMRPSLDDIMEHSIPEILKMLRQGIGVGLDFGVLSPRLSEDETNDAVFPGPVEVLRAIVQCATPLMAYGGLKHAAFMGALPVHHPDIFEFIRCKKNYPLEGINISVSIGEDFSKNYKKRGFIQARILSENGLRPFYASELKFMEQRAVRRKVQAPDLFLIQDQVASKQAKRIVGKVVDDVIYFDTTVIMTFLAECAHACGEPGILNLQAINEHNPTRGMALMSVTTPCGEQPLLPYEMCYLGSLCLPSFIENGQFNINDFHQAAHDAVYLMDDLIDIDSHEHAESRAICLQNRKIGVGIMGLADALAKLKIPYGSEESFNFVQKVMNTLKTATILASEKLAEERGEFPNWPLSQFAQDGLKPRRHATLTTLAPTGHISRLAACSPSIEPYYLFNKVPDALADALGDIGYSLEAWVEASAKQNFIFDGTLGSLMTNPTTDDDVNKKLQEIQKNFPCAQEISPHVHLTMMHRLQQFVDNGISKTINLPESTTVQEVQEIFEQALALNLKGVTVFRQGCWG
jgi:ribonucleoside-diphosphate reductase alpha chain